MRRQRIGTRENLSAQDHANFSCRIERHLWTCLAGWRPAAIGFELARAETIHPEPQDIPLDAVVTETGSEIYSNDLLLSWSADSMR